MENIGFNITEYDIREYLKKHKNDVAIKYKEAMFVKYMREHQEITQESLEILMEKYNWQDSVVNGIYYRDSNGILKSEALSDFNSYLDGITNLDSEQFDFLKN
jgi:PP-loop superfamily ATP-utilizing enzyme